jgi:ABC-2 type transport system ATP-binding protein
MRRQKVEAVRDLTLAVEAGEIFGFVGPNGAGKSSTIKIICNLIHPTAGRVSLMGKDVSLPEARKQVGYLPENPSYYDYLTGEELLAFNGTIHGMKADKIRQRSRELLEMISLADSARRPIRTYSKGMVQRLGIAASLIHDPQVLIWDEPMSGLDPIGRKQTADLMLKLRGQGKTIFFSTHILADVEHVCDRIGMIVQGELTYIGQLEEILAAAIEKYHLSFRTRSAHGLDLPGPSEAAVRSGLHHVEVAPADLGGTVKQLLEEGVEIVRIEPKRLRLEDVFVALSNKD